MFIVKGHLAVCEPDGVPFCIYSEGSYLGEFQILKHVPSVFQLKVSENYETETILDRQSGWKRLVATINVDLSSRNR
jgi:hypothetical protein